MILSNVRLVLENEVISGSLSVDGGIIQSFDIGSVSLPGAIDGEGGYLMPGMIELHTDNMEKHFSPRPGVRWPSSAAFKVHDSQMVSAGITTVFDAVAIGDVIEHSERLANLQTMVQALLSSREAGHCRADHRLHFRCEISHADTLNNFEDLLKLCSPELVSVMDHSPGQRQFANIDRYRQYYQGKYRLSDVEMEAFIVRQMAASEQYGRLSREAICKTCHERGIVLASHDDATSDHIGEALSDGMSIAEFPTTTDAALAAHTQGLSVVMGAPNVVRGGSHSGNVAALDLASLGTLDVLSSDYYPSSLLDAIFKLADDSGNDYDLSSACALVTQNPAEVLELHDRGRIETGFRADLILCHPMDDHVHIQQVWREGERVF
ncbi:MAG: Alpha-D-ribose 1-methylphosphonate 5-triphosphate diphosphatase [Candidatus Celerinatantimonas neptuna]|nr:MAG: Alpha-D-ribose 1-methylphosphonate 5-triphosphate diphosphatase [Candidatus Celerinatantimonas neptuna]